MEEIKNNYLSLIYNTKARPKTNYPDQLVKYLTSQFKLTQNSKVLEVGCGRGDFLTAFQKANFNCVGVDLEQSSLDLSPNLDISICDISKESLPYKNNSIDIVFHKSLIEHLYDPSTLMKETYRILKPNGKLIILTPDWHTQMKNFYDDFTHCRPFVMTTMLNVLKVYNFKNTKAEKFYQLPIIWKYPAIKILSKFLQMFCNVYCGRWLTNKTKSKFFRFSVELMILG